ncbi:hypothetical protein BDQ17DRAFT_1114 [Cyathus striatus]|nr:hypothetical protein BDQ17DRAFT_1114 [Cyathus striatus]
MMTAVPPPDSIAPSAFKIQHSSPLDSLVRRASSRRVKAAAASSDAAYRHIQPTIQTDIPSQVETSIHRHDPSFTPPRQLLQQHLHLSPSSPILHGRFTRDSVATASEDNSSYLDPSRVSVDSRNVYQESELEYRYYDTDSVYSDATSSPALRDSWQSAATTDTLRPPSHIVTISNDILSSPSRSANQQPRMLLPHPSTPTSSLPTVVVSSPTPEARTSNSRGHAGRAAIIRPITSNFSRPARSLDTAGTPPPPPTDEEQKRRVLERNMRRNPSPGPSSYSQTAPSPSLRNQTSNSHLSDTSTKPSSLCSRSTGQDPQDRTPSLLVNPPVSSTVLDLQNLSLQGSMSLLTPFAPSQPSSVRSDSPKSVYSDYSYYPLDSATPSPISAEFHHQSKSRGLPQQQSHINSQQNNQLQSLSGNSNSRRPASPQVPRSDGTVTEATASTPQDFLQLGIQHHEANRLKESAIYFERSAKENGGCGVGMLMWGLALRHGWGCEKNEKMGFKWLRKAAEHAVVDLESARSGGAVDKSAIQTELVLAIYEVGQCFFHGWGVPKDQKMAVSYYAVAARLGDSDAQMDLAFCFANGKGCKKDRKEAAKWYRAAVAQGQSDIGLAWIYKEKYQ